MAYFVADINWLKYWTDVVNCWKGQEKSIQDFWILPIGLSTIKWNKSIFIFFTFICFLIAQSEVFNDSAYTATKAATSSIEPSSFILFLAIGMGSIFGSYLYWEWGIKLPWHIIRNNFRLLTCRGRSKTLLCSISRIFKVGSSQSFFGIFLIWL